MAAGAVVQRRADAGDAVQHFAGGGRALRLELLAAHHVARAGVFEDVDGAGIGQPVADHGDRLQIGRLFARRDLQGEGAVFPRLCLQAGAGEQRGERLGRGVLAIQRLAAAAGGLFRAEGDQHAGLLAQVVERLLQRFGGNAVVLAGAADLCGAEGDGRRQGRSAEAGEKQGTAQGRKGAGKGHLGKCSGVLQVGFPPPVTREGKRLEFFGSMWEPHARRITHQRYPPWRRSSAMKRSDGQPGSAVACCDTPAEAVATKDVQCGAVGEDETRQGKPRRGMG
ncbi:hypothetical protein D9M71_477720 [compost metagenome]